MCFKKEDLLICIARGRDDKSPGFNGLCGEPGLLNQFPACCCQRIFVFFQSSCGGFEDIIINGVPVLPDQFTSFPFNGQDCNSVTWVDDHLFPD